MKKLNQIFAAAVFATTLSLGFSAEAQYKVIQDDGIAASPKLRQMLNERKFAKAVTVRNAEFAVSQQRAMKDGIAASPKVRQSLNEQKARARDNSQVSAVASVGYKPTGSDGITASPRTRQQINERTPSVLVAPVK
ncbi:MAG TPA: hypothetical protein VN673_09555 [Clostridia bacterium]|nr:hypothetical protein [Clostridia bacterium]